MVKFCTVFLTGEGVHGCHVTFDFCTRIMLEMLITGLEVQCRLIPKSLTGEDIGYLKIISAH